MVRNGYCFSHLRTPLQFRAPLPAINAERFRHRPHGISLTATRRRGRLLPVERQWARRLSPRKAKAPRPDPRAMGDSARGPRGAPRAATRKFEFRRRKGVHPCRRVGRPNSCQTFANLFKSKSSLCAAGVALTPLRSFRQRRSGGSPSSCGRTQGRPVRSEQGASRLDLRTDHQCRPRNLQSPPRDPPDRSHRVPARRLGSASDRPGHKKRPEQRAGQGYRRGYWPKRKWSARASRLPRVEINSASPRLPHIEI
jgi:hypothetical protein